MNIFGQRIYSGPEKRTQLLIRDDGKLEFRKLCIKDGFMVIKEGDDIKQGWLHYHTNQFSFVGYKNISADMVTLASTRDILLDDFNILRPEDKPAKGAVYLGKPGVVKRRIQDIAEAARHRIQVRPGTSWLVNRITLVLGICLFIMTLALAIQFAT